MFLFFFFFFNDTATTEIYTLSLHDALPISSRYRARRRKHRSPPGVRGHRAQGNRRLLFRSKQRCPQCFERNKSRDRKSTRLNSSHLVISYAVFCLKKKNQPTTSTCLRQRSR